MEESLGFLGFAASYGDLDLRLSPRYFTVDSPGSDEVSIPDENEVNAHFDPCPDRSHL